MTKGINDIIIHFNVLQVIFISDQSRVFYFILTIMQSQSILLIVFIFQVFSLIYSDGAKRSSEMPRLLIISLDGEMLNKKI